MKATGTFRVFDKRLIVVKTKNERVRKIAVLDVLTNLMFAIEVPEMVSMEELVLTKNIWLTYRVYTSKELGDVDEGFPELF